MLSRNRIHYLNWIVPLVLIALFWGCSSPEEQRYKEALELKNSGKIDEALQILDGIQTDDKNLQSQTANLKQEIKALQQYNQAIVLKEQHRYAEALQVLDKINTDNERLQSEIANLR
jgi:hypothetical protein